MRLGSSRVRTPEESITRREFVLTASALAAFGAASACVHGMPRHEEGPLVHVGTYTEGGRHDGIHRFRMDGATGILRPLATFDAGPNPSFLALHPNGRVLYAINEIDDFEGRASGAVAAFEVASTGAPVRLGTRRSSGGVGPAYVSVDRAGRFVLVANYGGGSVAVLPVGQAGSVGEATAIVQHHGRGPNAERQEGPHAHCVIPDPSNQYVLVADLGIDRILVYRLDGRDGTLVPARTPFVAVRPGAGPRHLAFHPNGRWLYSINELDQTIGSFAWDADAGRLAPLATLSLLAAPPTGETAAADLHVAPSGRFLYATVRGTDVVVVCAIHPTSGMLTVVQRIWSGGSWPRNLAIDPSGRFVFVANQRSNTLVGFRVDVESGLLTPSGDRVQVPAPVCILFGGG